MKEIRTCIACRRRLEKKELIRIVSEEGRAVLDEKKTKQTRGVYVCNDCLNKKESIKKIFRTHKMDTTDTEIKRLINELGELQIGKN